MSGSRYRPFAHDNFAALMTEMGFREVLVVGTQEYVYERVIHNGPFSSKRFMVQIFSSVDKRTGVSRDTGNDAIRVLLIDSQRKDRKPVKDWTVHRTMNAFPNTRENARKAWGYVMNPSHHCPDCGALLLSRKGRRGDFLGCTNYPECKFTRQMPEIAQAA